MIRLGRFFGTDKSKILDLHDLKIPITTAIDPILNFIARHTSTAATIGRKRRTNIPQYPEQALRECVINALLHTNYALTGVNITVAIFDDRIEITNPGGLPIGLSMDDALAGVSQIRNRIIGRVFKELELIEHWGSGLRRITNSCLEHGLAAPKFEEVGNFFRTTLYLATSTVRIEAWHQPIISYLNRHKKITPKRAQVVWNVTARTAGIRLKKMCTSGILVEFATSPFDPDKVFCLKNGKK